MSITTFILLYIILSYLAYWGIASLAIWMSDDIGRPFLREAAKFFFIGAPIGLWLLPIIPIIFLLVERLQEMIPIWFSGIKAKFDKLLDLLFGVNK